MDLPVVILQQLPRLEELQLWLHLEHGSNELVSLHFKLLLLPLCFQPLLLFHVELAGELGISLLRKLALALVFFKQEFVLNACFALQSFLGAIYAFLALRCNLSLVVLHKLVLALHHLLDVGYRRRLTLHLSAQLPNFDKLCLADFGAVSTTTWDQIDLKEASHIKSLHHVVTVTI